jgi:UbiD family decarboxylase
MGTVFDGLQEFVDAAMEIDDYRIIQGADWDEEIGALLEASAELIPRPPMMIFDQVKGYPEGYRIAMNVLAGHKRLALALGLDVEGKSKEQLIEVISDRLREGKEHPIPPVEVPTGRVMENVLTGDDIDLFKFPVPRYRAADGGRYIGTYDCVITRDPESGYVNSGTYRLQVHEKDLLGLWISPGHHGRLIAQRYWDRGESCPIVATFGQDPIVFWVSHNESVWGEPELDHAGGLRTRAVEVIKGPLTGLPIPAHAEIAIEGEVPPPSKEARDEGPFGESPGYYAGGTLGTGEAQPVIRVKALYHRNNPILGGGCPLWPGAYAEELSDAQRVRPTRGTAQLRFESRVPGVIARATHVGLTVISIKQLYPGHAQQVALASLEGRSGGGWRVIVDETIDPTNIKEVLWAITSRTDPSKGIDIIRNLWSTPLNPGIPPAKRAVGDWTEDAVVIYALPPFHEKDDYPQSSRAPRELKRRMVEKFRGVLPFPENARI